jgi:ATP-dependent helicase HrpB
MERNEPSMTKTLPPFPTLPICDVLDDILVHLSNATSLIIAAPPGAGKTTLIPLALLSSPWMTSDNIAQRIILIEPRRLAARAAARRMAQLLGEDVGQTAGYRMRLDTRISAKTRIEVVTEGVFTRMVLDDPELKNIACVIFDEFHERALDADFGLALALDVQAGLREDLKIIVMSATLDIDEISKVLVDAKTVISQGRSHPIDIRYQPRRPADRIEDVVVSAVKNMHASEEGSILCFLPGMGEINRVFERLEGQLGDDTDVFRLYGSLGSQEQDNAIKPSELGRRKVVLATSIAETSITIDGVRIIIDAGLQRQAFFESVTGITRLETVRASQAATTQRAGRAGRTAPGIALRLWQKEQQVGLPEFSPPQILTSDLSALLLDCLAWGVQDISQLAFLTAPPETALEAAFELLRKLGAIDHLSRLTHLGQQMRDLPLPVRLSAMVLSAQKKGAGLQAAKLAVLLTEQGLGGPSIDIETRLKHFNNDKGIRAKSAKKLAERIAKSIPKTSVPAVMGQIANDEILAVAFPDRIAKQRGQIGVYTMANGRGANLDELDPLAKEDMLVIADLTGRANAPRILSACRFDVQTIDTLASHQVLEIEECRFDRQSMSVRGRRVRKLGAISLSEKPMSKPKGEAALQALIDGIRQFGHNSGLSHLPFSKSILQYRDRSEFHRTHSGTHSEKDWPDMSDDGLLATMENWFLPFQNGVNAIRDIKADSLTNGVKSLLTWELQNELEKTVPTHFTFPDGKRIEIQYKDGDALLSVRVQQLYGQSVHPSIMSGKVPLLLELLSPAGRPIQLTRDLPGFWQGSWKDVRADQRGRYPKHDWPDNPVDAKPPKPRKRYDR